MPDITMCTNIDCPLKNKCYRFQAKPDMLQSYSDFEPIGRGECEYFWSIEEEE